MYFSTKVVLFFSLLSLSACAHSYYYKAEIAGKGATFAEKGGVLYSIPPTQPVLTMRVRSLGVHKMNGVQMLGVRMTFLRPTTVLAAGPSSVESINPAELFAQIGDRKDIKPIFVHAKTKTQTLIVLAGGSHEFIEMLYPLGKEYEGAVSVPVYFFRWTVHYGNGQKEQQTTRFDRYDSSPEQGAELYPEDNDYPYDISPMQMPGWTIEHDPYWWPWM